MSNPNYLLDTNILMDLESWDELPKELNKFIHYCSIGELDRRKNDDGLKGFKVRRAIRLIKDNLSNFTFIPLSESDDSSATVDSILMECANREGLVLLTNDVSLQLLATFSGYEVASWTKPTAERHKGYREVLKGSESVSELLQDNMDLLKGEYLIIREHGMVKHIYIRCEKGLSLITETPTFVSQSLPKLVPKDEYQLCAFDSIIRNQITFLTGSAGTGKTLISISAIFNAIKEGVADKVVIFTNPTKAKGAEELGFYSGSKEEKLLQNAIGSILSSKIGGEIEVQRLLDSGVIEIMPMSDIRGYEVPENAILYVTEAQNANVELLQLALERVGESMCIMEGDPYAQLDHWSFIGEGNGMLRAIEVFAGEKEVDFGHIELPIVYRSKVAEIAQRMSKK